MDTSKPFRLRICSDFGAVDFGLESHKTEASFLSMKPYFFAVVAGTCLSVLAPALSAAAPAPTFIYETPQEFFGRGDFDGDGRADIVIVDKETGKYRLGYQLTPGVFTWVDNRPSGIKGISGFSIGKLLTNNLDALAFTSPDANQITMVDVSSPSSSARPVIVPFTAALGPNTVVAIEAGGAGGKRLQDLYVGSIYNSPEPNQAALLKNDGAEFPKLAEATLPGPAKTSAMENLSRC